MLENDASLPEIMSNLERMFYGVPKNYKSELLWEILEDIYTYIIGQIHTTIKCKEKRKAMIRNYFSHMQQPTLKTKRQIRL